jgi:zinc protease
MRTPGERASTTSVDRSVAPEAGPLRPFGFPTIERFELDNGLPVLFARTDGLPVASLSVIARAGGTQEPEDRTGLASLTSDLLESGAGTRSGTEIAEAMEGLGIQMSVGSSWDVSHVDLTGLGTRLAGGAEIAADMVRHPTFPPEEVERLRQEHLAAVLQRRADPRGLANEMASRFIFAPDAPFSRPLGGTTESLPRIGREDIVAHHRDRYVPGRAAIIVVGAITRQEATDLVSGFGRWEGVSSGSPTVAANPRFDARRVFIVDRPGWVQSEIRVGHVGVARAAPDYFPILVMNTIPGGAFTSRLNLSLREKHGYTYGVSSAFAMRFDPGPFLVATAVQTEVTAGAVREIFAELEGMRERRVTDEELRDARNYQAGVFPLTLQTTSGIASRLAEIHLYGLPDDYFERYPREILNVHADQVLNAARDHLSPDRAVVVIAGDAEKIRSEIEGLDLGPVEVVQPTELP